MSKELPKILIIDDEPSNIAAIADALDGQNYNIIAANNGKYGLEFASISFL